MPLRPAPEGAGALAGFPSRPITGTWHRVWRYQLPDEVRASPWWFASIPAEPDQRGGRYDLPPALGGTCYLASSAVAAVLEVLQDHLRLIPLAELRVRRRVTVDVPQEAPAAADATAPPATGFGVTPGLWTSPDRTVTQGWAAALRRDGWWALHAGIHHDVTGTERALALFDVPGEHPPTHRGTWATSAPISLEDDPELLDELATRGCRPAGPANLPPAP